MFGAIKGNGGQRSKARLKDGFLGLLVGAGLVIATGFLSPASRAYHTDAPPGPVVPPAAAKLEQQDLIDRLSAKGLGLDPAKVSNVLDHHWWELPCRGDTENMLPLLRLAYQGQVENPIRFNGVLVDIGANVGQTSSAILSFFSNLDFRRFVKEQGGDGVVCGKAQEPVAAKVFALEPGKAVGAKLEKHANARGWFTEGKFELLRYAAGDTDVTATFADGGNEISALVVGGKKDGTSSYEVQVARLDTVYEKHWSKHSDKVFLLKMDCEGHDPKAIDGAEKLLSAKKAKFLLFEYNKFWFNVDPDTSLRKVTTRLWDWGYVCFLITPKHLLPISDKHWHPSFEIRKWSNVFCGQRGDSDLDLVLTAFHNSPWSSKMGSYRTVDEYFFHCEGKACVVPSK